MRALYLAPVLLLAACPLPGSSAGGRACTAETTSILRDVFTPRCGDVGCHAASNPANGLDLVSPGIEVRTMNRPAAGCVGQMLVVPGDPDRSLMIRKLSGKPTCGVPMPVGEPLRDEEVTCIREWIQSLRGPGPLPATPDGGAPGPGLAPDAGIASDRPPAAPDAPREASPPPRLDGPAGPEASPPPPDVGCAAGQTACGSTCVNTATDSANCGGCGKACPPSDTCIASACVRRKP
jgi:hypothetical protein